MSQFDIADIMRTLRLSGDDRFRSPKEFAAMLDSGGLSGLSIHQQLSSLHRFGFVDVRYDGVVRKYRIKEKYVGKPNKSQTSLQNRITNIPLTRDTTRQASPPTKKEDNKSGRAAW